MYMYTTGCSGVMYRTSLNTCLGVYLLQHSVDPASKQGSLLNGASVYRTSCRSAKFINVARAPFALNPNYVASILVSYLTLWTEKKRESTDQYFHSRLQFT